MERTLALLLGISLPFALAQAQTSSGQPMQVGVEFSVAADGSVSTVVPDPKLPEPIRKLLVDRASLWRFKPAEWHNKPVSTDTFLALRLLAIPTTQGGFALRVLGQGNVNMLEGSGYRINPPKYPVEAMKSGAGGEFIYAVAKDESGKVKDVRLLDPLDYGKDKIMRALDESSHQAILSSVYRPSTADGNAIACEFVFPMSFSTKVESQSDNSEAAKSTRMARAEKARSQITNPCPATSLETTIENTLL